MKVTTGDLIANDTLTVTAVANPGTTNPRVSATDDHGAVVLLRWDGTSWQEETP